MHPNAELLTRFYQAFARGDAATMRQAYAPGATFSDADGYADAVRRVGAERKPLGVQALRYSKRFDWSAVLGAWREEIDRCRAGRASARAG